MMITMMVLMMLMHRLLYQQILLPCAPFRNIIPSIGTITGDLTEAQVKLANRKYGSRINPKYYKEETNVKQHPPIPKAPPMAAVAR